MIQRRHQHSASDFDNFASMISALQQEALAICVDRQKKYGPHNVTRAQQPLYALAVRMGDKLARLEHLCSGSGQVTNDESVDDTLLDLANYAIIALAVRRGLWRADYCPPLVGDV